MEPSTNYPSNSRLKKEEPKIPEITKVDLKGKASVRDKSMGERFTSLFDKRDFQDIFYHVLENVIVPNIKNLLYDSLTKGSEIAIYGDSRPVKGSSRLQNRYSGSTYTSRYTRPTETRPSETTKVGDAVDFGDIFFDNRMDAEVVLDQINQLMEQYGRFTVSWLYELIGVRTPYTNNSYGWTDISQARVKTVRDGYILSLPNPKPLDSR